MSPEPLLLRTSVTVDAEWNADVPLAFIVLLQTDAFELTVRIPAGQVALLDRVASSPWSRASVRIGDCAGMPAFWSVGERPDHGVAILLGQDDECWHIGVALPLDTPARIRDAIARCSTAPS